jgi:2-polyprenyl-3-methyl-5-hydroxy-6-metoxy-1,4-benzoquinol methylase
MSEVMSEAKSERPILARAITTCRHCGAPLSIPFCDLGKTPLANSFVTSEAAAAEPAFPLNTVVCERCFLVQLDHVADATAIFSDYAYFSSYSSSWLAHCERFVAGAIARFGLDKGSFVVEVASNDGYLLQYFVAAGVPSLGVEPAGNVAAAARARGVPTREAFFGLETAQAIVAESGHADLVIANNVFAHVPDVNDFTDGLAALVGPSGVVSIEAPHLLSLVDGVQFDTIYHEHYAYWSLHAMSAVFARAGLTVFDVEQLPTHGGSLRVFAAADGATRGESPGLIEVRRREAEVGIDRPDYYAGFQPRVRRVLDGFTAWLGEAKRAGRRVAGYGAAAKGNTFLNAAGVSDGDLVAVADLNPAKQDKLLPGSHVPVVSPDALAELAPDDVLILPWNLADEIAASLSALVPAARLWVAVPEMRQVGGPR